ncbi:MAG: 5'/3'-nucleotidase SurE [Candidatus Hydrogenedens sp.]|nr:5'/3'-nucleotidase SurE [Candidatus Hydrogenedens sp.]
MASPLILLTNDDGIHAPGLHALADSLSKLGTVRVFAPDRERSAVSHGISLHQPLRVKPYREGWWMVDGTPADCVLLAVRFLMEARPALVVSGINNGPNLGDDVTYSGTVAGAREGMMVGVPSIAVSMVSYDPQYFTTGGEVALRLGRYVLEHGLPDDTALNVNVPDVPFEELNGAAITRMGRRHYEDDVIHRTDPRGRDYYWIGGAATNLVSTPGTDIGAVLENQVSITPLHRDATHHDAIARLYETPFTL